MTGEAETVRSASITDYTMERDGTAQVSPQDIRRGGDLLSKVGMASEARDLSALDVARITDC